MFGQDKVKLLLIVDVRVIIRFPFKRPQSKMKNNFNNIFSKRSSGVSKVSLKICKHTNYCVFSFSYQWSFIPYKSISKQALSHYSILKESNIFYSIIFYLLFGKIRIHPQFVLQVKILNQKKNSIYNNIIIFLFIHYSFYKYL